MRLCPARLSPPGGWGRMETGRAKRASIEKVGVARFARPARRFTGPSSLWTSRHPLHRRPFHGALVRDRTFTSAWRRTSGSRRDPSCASRAQPGSSAPPPAASQLTGIIARFRTDGLHGHGAKAGRSAGGGSVGPAPGCGHRSPQPEAPSPTRTRKSHECFQPAGTKKVWHGAEGRGKLGGLQPDSELFLSIAGLPDDAVAVFTFENFTLRLGLVNIQLTRLISLIVELWAAF